ncbi:MAG: hypothetical protein M3Y24_09720 [Acidobacteriota bacterium]|nr:hypothetical protein [Acidobacteriota bacterium]
MKRVSGAYALCFRDAPLHLSWSMNLERRLRRFLLSSVSDPDTSRASLRKQLTAVECWPTGSRLELNLLLYRLAKQFYPDRYLTFLKLRMPWFVRITGEDPYPRLETANRVPPHFKTRFDALWGPFVSRAAAQQYEQELLGLFQIRRCSEILVPDPDHPGCIYGEMSQCLRPCQAAVTATEYGSEALRVRDFLESNGRSAIAALSSARNRACEETEFEQAAQMHKRLERMKATAALRERIVTEVHEFNGVALTRALQEGRFVLWPMLEGNWQEPVTLDFLTNELQTKSLDTEIRELLAAKLQTGAITGGNRAEELAIFSRWYYSSWRDGEWFPFRSLADLNYRKLVRELSRMAQPAPVPA